MTALWGCQPKKAPSDGGGSVESVENAANSNNAFKAKSASITYQKVDGGAASTEYVMWDDYGRLWRVGNDVTSSIMDEKNGKAYSLNHRNKTYVELDKAFVTSLRMGRDAFSFRDNSQSEGYTALPDRVIAGRTCTVYSTVSSGVTQITGGQPGFAILLKEESGLLEGTSIKVDETFTAVSCSDSPPPGSFTVPADYSKEE
jgi:hypothetical protein